MKKPKNWWYIWSKSLGEKASSCNKTSDKVAVVRTIIFATYLITNAFIIAGVIRHWNDNQPIEIFIEQHVPSGIPQTQEKGILKTNSNFAYD